MYPEQKLKAYNCFQDFCDRIIEALKNEENKCAALKDNLFLLTKNKILQGNIRDIILFSLKIYIILYDLNVTFNEKALRKKSVKMTASEMRTFVRIFALLVGDLVPDYDPVWKFYLILRDIIDIILSRQIQKEIIKILKERITEHHRLYVFLFHDTLKPKHYHMVHYPSILPQSGALISLACDRFKLIINQLYKMLKLLILGKILLIL
jgi:hypothetical protein